LIKVQIRYEDRPGALQSAFEVFEKHGLSIQEFHNTSFKNREACVADIKLMGNTLSNIQEFVRSDILAGGDFILDVTF
jgi:prephenate dehydratase